MILATKGSSRCFKRVSLVASRSVRTQRPSSSSASSAYTGSFDRNDPSTSTSPVGYTPDQRNILDIALRVDQAGEVAANWIYKGQMAVLGRDAVVGPLIQVISRGIIFGEMASDVYLGNVGPRKEASSGHGQVARAAPCAAHFAHRYCTSGRLRRWRCDCAYGEGSGHGLHRGSGDSHWGTLRRVRYSWPIVLV